MATQPLSPFGLKLQLEEKPPHETIVHCKGKITAENSELFQRQIRDLIPESRPQITKIARRIIVDLSNVTHVDSTGLGALLRVWTAAQNKGCDFEITNLNPRVEKLVEITRLDTVFKRARIVAAGASAAALPAVGEPLTALEPEEAYQQAFRGRDGCSPCPSTELRDLDSRIDRRRSDAGSEVLRSQPLSDPPA